MLRNMECEVQDIKFAMESNGFKLTEQDLQELRFDVMALKNPEDMIDLYTQNKGRKIPKPTHYTFSDFKQP